jgi:hypothetical protein
MDRFNLKRFNEVMGEEMSSQIGLQTWEIWMPRWILVAHKKLSEKYQHFSQRESRLS